MMIPILAAESFCIVTTAIHVASTLIAIIRCRSPAIHQRAPAHAPAVSLVRPVCGIENYGEETLASAFELDYPRDRIAFCVPPPQHRVAPTVRRPMPAYPS